MGEQSLDSAWRSALEYPTLRDPRISSLGAIAVEVTWPDGTTEVEVNWPAGCGAPGCDERSVRLAGHLPAWSPDGERLAVADGGDGAIRIEHVGNGTGTTLDVGPGIRLESLAWVDDGWIAALAAPVEADTAVGAGAVRHAGGREPIVRSVGAGARRLIEVPVDGGTSRSVDVLGMTIWEMTPCPGGGYVTIASDGPLETDWYKSVVAHVDAVGSARVLYRSEWQLARPSLDPDGRRVVVTEGWSSDRGHLAGDARVVDLTTCVSTSWHITDVDVVAFEWIDDERMAYWGWMGCASSAGICDASGRSDDTVADVDVTRDLATRIVGETPVSAAVRLRTGSAPVVVAKTCGGNFEPIGTVRPDAVFSTSVEAHELVWPADDGTEIQGLLCTSADHGVVHPLVVMVHGGPANLWSRHLPLGALALVDAGFAVLLPNPRGSVGRGQAFARANLGDPSGAELDDVFAGVEHCRGAGLVADCSPGIIGGSYGGYLTSCAATFGHDVAAAVMMFGHPDLISARFGSNNPAFYDILVGGPPDREHVGTYIRCSPVLHAHPGAAPTLILHGDADACTPVNQGEEFFMALREQGVTTEFIVYPGSGHGLRGAATQSDVWERATAWFRQHLRVSK